jgi:serralysin
MLENLTHVVQTVNLKRQYQNPVVFAQPLSHNGGNTAVVRILEVQPDRFTLFVHEPPDLDGLHAPESVSYMVLEAGSWELDDGARLIVGRVETSATVGQKTQNTWERISFETPFSASPAVITQVQSNQDSHWVKTRKRRIEQTGFQFAMEEEEVKTTPHGSEVVGWLAIERSQGSWSGHLYEAGETERAVRHVWKHIAFRPGFQKPPHFIASLASYYGTNNCALRYDADSLTTSSVRVHVEEDTTLDDEMSHTTEAVAYLAIEAEGLLAAKPWSAGGG